MVSFDFWSLVPSNRPMYVCRASLSISAMGRVAVALKVLTYLYGAGSSSISDKRTMLDGRQ